MTARPTRARAISRRAPRSRMLDQSLSALSRPLIPHPISRRQTVSPTGLQAVRLRCRRRCPAVPISSVETVFANQSCAGVATKKAALPAWERGPTAAVAALWDEFGLAEQLQDVLAGRVGDAERLNGELLLGLQG